MIIPYYTTLDTLLTGNLGLLTGKGVGWLVGGPLGKVSGIGVGTCFLAHRLFDTPRHIGGWGPQP